MKSFLPTISLCLLALCVSALAPAQGIQMLQEEYKSDSSYYDIHRIAPGRYWMAGENGLLNEMDASGTITKVHFPQAGLDILRIQTHGDNVYVGTSRGGLFKYDLISDKWSRASVPQNFDRRCFYDLLVLPEQNKLIVSGGHQKIATGKKVVPLGFIASIDLDFEEELSILYKNSLSFVWALEYAGGKVYASSFKGVNSHILTASINSFEFKKQMTVPGLIHHLQEKEGSIYYSGTASTKYAQHGIVGKIGGTQESLDGFGCIWSIKPMGDIWIGLNYYGDILFFDEQLTINSRLPSTGKSMYELAVINSHQAVVVGHGNQSLLLDMKLESKELSLNR